MKDTNFNHSRKNTCFTPVHSLRNILHKSRFNCEWVKSLSGKYNQPSFRNWTEKYITLKLYLACHKCKLSKLYIVHTVEVTFKTRYMVTHQKNHPICNTVLHRI